MSVEVWRQWRQRIVVDRERGGAVWEKWADWRGLLRLDL